MVIQPMPDWLMFTWNIPDYKFPVLCFCFTELPITYFVDVTRCGRHQGFPRSAPDSFLENHRVSIKVK